ncbi:hypothetical protein BZG13_08010, partial [Salinivibrio sp. ML323]|uniref:hypothetical protein n=1 Tax=Salinivibrio sp. ML323 TaxID=1909474 RepID=UPI0009CE0CCB
IIQAKNPSLMMNFIHMVKFCCIRRAVTYSDVTAACVFAWDQRRGDYVIEVTLDVFSDQAMA